MRRKEDTKNTETKKKGQRGRAIRGKETELEEEDEEGRK